MAIIGAHVLLYSAQPEELRSVLGKAFGWASVDAGQGWLIFGLPDAEIAVHPGDNPGHELSLMCDDLATTMADLAKSGVVFDGQPKDEGWGVVVTMILPGELRVLLYEPRHPTAFDL